MFIHAADEGDERAHNEGGVGERIITGLLGLYNIDPLLYEVVHNREPVHLRDTAVPVDLRVRVLGSEPDIILITDGHDSTSLSNVQYRTAHLICCDLH